MQKLDIASIFILKSNLKYKKDIKRLGTLLNNDSRIKEWNVDFADVDKVIRIEAENVTIREVIQLLRMAGFCCEELEG